jgi:hypothetical protein
MDTPIVAQQVLEDVGASFVVPILGDQGQGFRKQIV